MYLLTFAFLIIGMLGIYTQVLAVQTARLAASQTGIAQAMTDWHGAALSLANNVISPLPASGTSCSLTSGYTPAGVAYCQPGLNVAVISAAPNTVVTGSYTFNGHAYPHLPAAYNTALYQWNSILYNYGGSYYVVTFVQASASAPGFVSTATGSQITYTQADIYRQLQRAGFPIMNYGYVEAGTLTTPATISGVPVTYTNIPLSAVPSGSLAIISNSSQCSGC